MFVKATAAFFSARYGDVLALANDGLRNEPHLALGGARIFALLGLARHGEAVATAELAVRLSSRQPPAVALLGPCYRLAGARDAAVSILAELTGRAAAEHIPSWAFAEVHAGLDDASEALNWLERAIEERALIAWLSARHSPWFAGVRAMRRFQVLSQRVAAEQLTA